MTYALGSRSRTALVGVHPLLVSCVEKAIVLSTQDFTVVEGVRSHAAELANVAKGTSRTTHSLHEVQPDGFGHAVDLVPFVNGELAWNWSHIYPITLAMQKAATELGIANRIRWGGVWDKRLDQLGPYFAADVVAYCSRHVGSDLLDGPHYELR